MLFSHEGTAAFLNERFEPAWTSLRPVPTITVDLGEGKKSVRTLHGNIATFVCAADGTVIDALPGLYDPATYRQALAGILEFEATLAALKPAAREQALADYHRKRAEHLRMVQSLAKALVEMPRESALARLSEGGGGAARAKAPTQEEFLALVSRDARAAESVGRAGVHTLLLEAGPTQPAAVARRIYRLVLRCDLDDPALGLDPGLVGKDPIEEAFGR